MIPERYFAPSARTIFDDNQKVRRWFNITTDYMRDAIHTDKSIDVDESISLDDRVRDVKCPDAAAVATRETVTGHDVVAFLSLVEQDCPPALLRYLHYGLTSSDLVDNGHFQAMWRHATVMWEHTRDLQVALKRWENMATPRAGRTHGQIADVTSWGYQMWVQYAVFDDIERDLEILTRQTPLKSAGPTGRSVLRPRAAQRIGQLSEQLVVPSTQVIPRDHQLRWACVYLRLACAYENLALQVRLAARSEVGEVREGASRVGSSAMPHKKNPIDSEKVCGMARLARGYVLALSEGVALWEDRDLTNSAMERVAVADLAATVEHMAITMTKVITDLQVDYGKMRDTAKQPETMSNVLQSLAQKHFGIGPVRAGELVRNHVQFRDPLYVDGHMIAKELGVSEGAVRLWANDAATVYDRMF